MGKKKRGKKKPNIMPVHLGNLLSEKIKEKGVTKAAIERKTNRANSFIAPLLKRPSMQTSLLWELSVVLKYNFFEQLSAALKQAEGDSIPSDNSSAQLRIAELEKEAE